MKLHVVGVHPTVGMRAYVAGPMTSIPEYNYPAFYKAKELLESIGLVVEIPPELCPQQDGFTYTDYFKADIEGMLQCEILVLLPGWPQSPGARAEMILGATMAMPTYFLIPGQALLVGMDRIANEQLTSPLYEVHNQNQTTEILLPSSSASSS